MPNDVHFDGPTMPNDVHYVPNVAVVKNMHSALSMESLSSTAAESTDGTAAGSIGTLVMGNCKHDSMYYAPKKPTISPSVHTAS